MNKPFNFGSGEGVYFTSDTHWGHKNIIDYCARPFGSVEEMNEALIDNWNSTVPENGIVFHLGDFAFGGSQLWNDTLNRLNGHIYLVRGNHENKNLREGYYQKLELIVPQMQIEIDGKSVYLNHYPFLCYGGSERGVWALHGHVHTSKFKNTGHDFERLKYLMPTQYDVGVDFNDFKPISWREVKERIQYQVDNNVNMLCWLNES